MTKERQRIVEGVINGVYAFKLWDGKKSLVRVIVAAGEDDGLTSAEVKEVLRGGNLLVAAEQMAKWRDAA
jgi:hypothetical protein